MLARKVTLLVVAAALFAALPHTDRLGPIAGAAAALTLGVTFALAASGSLDALAVARADPKGAKVGMACEALVKVYTALGKPAEVARYEALRAESRP